VELDLDLYRACLVNMRLYAWEKPYFILQADALVVDLEPGSPNWRFANRWSPPDWQTEMVAPGGGTYADWGRKRDRGEQPDSGDWKENRDGKRTTARGDQEGAEGGLT